MISLWWTGIISMALVITALEAYVVDCAFVETSIRGYSDIKSSNPTIESSNKPLDWLVHLSNFRDRFSYFQKLMHAMRVLKNPRIHAAFNEFRINHQATINEFKELISSVRYFK
jgi:hypothetical protein